jgi:DNA-binding NarL/FixJ family response regulator
MARPVNRQRSRIGLSTERCRQRHAEIAEAVRAGATAKQTAARFGVSAATVCRSCQQHGVPLRAGRYLPLAERRRDIAAAVSKGRTIEEAARGFAVSEGLVRRSCREHGVVAPDRLDRKRAVAEGQADRRGQTRGDAGQAAAA